MAGTVPPPGNHVIVPFGTALRILIRAELGRRAGWSPDGSDAQIAQLIENYLNSANGPLDLGIDCDGSGTVDIASPKAALTAAATGSCDCRVYEARAPERTIHAQAAGTTTQSAKGGSRGW